MDSSYGKWAGVALVAGIVGMAGYGVVREARLIGAGSIVMATGSPHYYELAQTYRRDLERYGVKYEVHDSETSPEGRATLKALLDEIPSVNAGSAMYSEGRPWRSTRMSSPAWAFR